MPAAIRPDGLLTPDDPAPFTVVGRPDGARVLIVCDHAGRRFPQRLGTLGLPTEATWRHIAWDIGAASLAMALAERLNAPALFGTYSRLVVDLNRAIDHPTAFTTDGDGHDIPGNQNLAAANRDARVAAIHAPYHERLGALLDGCAANGPSALISIHSFTPVMAGRARPWVAGVLWDHDDRLSAPLLQQLRADGVGSIGDNEPYSGRYPADYTLHRHGANRAIPHVSVEVRQDQLLTPRGIHDWATHLATGLRPALRHLGVLP